jgi:type I restriction enzyme S subunit
VAVHKGSRFLRLDEIGREVKDTIQPAAGRRYELYSVPAFNTGAPEHLDGAQIGSSKRAVQDGDILLCKINPRINRVWQVGPASSGLDQIASTEYLVLRLNDIRLGSWVMWYLRSPTFRRWITANVEGATGSHTRAKSPAILRQPIPLGLPDERDSLTAWIEMQTSRLASANGTLASTRAKVATYKRRILSEAFTSAEQRWPNLRIADVIQGGPQNGLYVPKSQYGQGVPILRIDDFQVGSSRSSGELQRVAVSDALASQYLLRPGDLVINRVNSPSHLGKALAVEGRNVPAVFESNMMRLRLKDEIEPRFVELYLSSPGGRDRLIRHAKWAVNQASINQTDVLRTTIPVPPRDDQLRITDALDRRLSGANRLVDGLAAALNRVPSLRNQILEGVFGA